MKEILDIALKFQGILGTAFGVIIALIATSLIKNLGRTYIYFRDWNMNISKRDGAGGLEPSAPEDANYGGYSFEMEIINTSETPRALRNIRVKFYSSKKLLSETIPYDDSTRKTWTGGTKSDPVKIISLPPKKMVYYRISGYIKKEDLKNLREYKKVYFESLTHNRRKVKRLIYKTPRYLSP